MNSGELLGRFLRALGKWAAFRRDLRQRRRNTPIRLLMIWLFVLAALIGLRWWLR